MYARERNKKAVNLMNEQKATLGLLFATALWGLSYLFMQQGSESLAPFNLTALRFSLAFVLLVPLLAKRRGFLNNATLKYGSVMGFFIFVIIALVIFGLKSTTTSNAGFIIGLTVCIVPLFKAMLDRRLPSLRVICGALFAVVGITLFTMRDDLTFHSGDILCFVGAVCSACHIIITDRAAKQCDGITLGIVQIGAAGIFGTLASFIFETPILPKTPDGWISVIMLAVFCSAIGFVMQAAAQKYTSPVRATFIFSLEPVFAALVGVFFLHETMTVLSCIGAAILLTGVFISEYQPKACV
jgi:drug/metabolite transporter (DMT)-like permease